MTIQEEKLNELLGKVVTEYGAAVMGLHVHIGDKLGLYRSEPRLTEGYRTGGGVAWGDHGSGCFCGAEKFYGPLYKANLVSEWLPALDDVTAKLKAGGSGCWVGLRHALRWSVTCALLLTLLLAARPALAQADGPCGATPDPAAAQACAQFHGYLGEMVERWAAGTSVTIPESTMTVAVDRYAHEWDANPVAYIPESTMTVGANGYVHEWDANPVAYIPESTMTVDAGGYAHEWDANPVAYIPESTMMVGAEGYAHEWDENPVAYIPESTMTVPLEELFGEEYAQVEQR